MVFNNMQAIPLECPSHTRTFVPYPATCQSPLLEMAFKWAVVDRLMVNA